MERSTIVFVISQLLWLIFLTALHLGSEQSHKETRVTDLGFKQPIKNESRTGETPPLAKTHASIHESFATYCFLPDEQCAMVLAQPF